MDSSPISSVACVSTTNCVATDIYGGVRYLYQTNTTTSGGPTASTATFGQTVTYKATVSHLSTSHTGTPTRYVTFSVGNRNLCKAVISKGAATCQARNAPAGTDTVNATYSGDILYAPSEGKASKLPSLRRPPLHPSRSCRQSYTAQKRAPPSPARSAPRPPRSRRAPSRSRPPHPPRSPQLCAPFGSQPTPPVAATPPRRRSPVAPIQSSPSIAEVPTLRALSRPVRPWWSTSPNLPAERRAGAGP